MPRVIIKKYISASLGLLRVPTYLLILQYIVIGVVYGLSSHNLFFTNNSLTVFVFELLVLCLMIAFWYVNGTSLNDLADYDIDLINLKNDKNRPLVTGIITKKQLTNIAIASGILAVLSASFLGTSILVLLLILALLNWAYSLKPFQISYRGGIAPALLPLGYVVLPLFSGYYLVSTAVNTGLIVITACLYLLFVARILLKDFRDVTGDARYGKKTFLLKYGVRKVCLSSGISFVFGNTLLLLFFIKQLGIHIFALLFLTSLGVTILYYLSKTKTWEQQKPYITIFGRVGTGILIVVAVAFSFQYKPVIFWKQMLVSFAVIGLVINSFGEILKNQSPK